MKKAFTGLLAVVAVVSIIANILLYYRYSSNRPLVTVGGDVITRKDYQDQVDFTAGKSVLNRMVFQTIVMQAAKKAGVAPAQADIDARFAMLQRSNPQEMQQIASNPVQSDDYKRNLAADIALENLRIRGVQATDAEVADYYKQHPEQFTLPLEVDSTLVVTNNSVDEGTAEDLLRQGTPEDVIARRPRMQVDNVNGFHVNTGLLPKSVQTEMKQLLVSLKPGEVKSMPDGPYFFTFRVNKVQAQRTPPLADIKDQVERVVKLQKAPSAQTELAELYREAKPEFDSDKYAAYFSDIQNVPAAPAAPRKQTASL